jgi:pilus assembly protein CpaF
VRGAEVADLLAALNTGHEGGCGTLHANSAADVPARIEALGMAAGLPQAAVHSQLAAAVDVVVHLGRDRHRDGRRALAEVAVLGRRGDGVVRAVPAAVVVDGRTREGPAAADLQTLLDGRLPS